MLNWTQSEVPNGNLLPLPAHFMANCLLHRSTYLEHALMLIASFLVRGYEILPYIETETELDDLGATT
jgi:hypothetical protein